MKKEETKSLIENLEKSVITVDNVSSSMIKQFKEGKNHGTKTYVDDIDRIAFYGREERAWSWRPGEFNIWTGYNNEGKSQALIFLSLLKAMNEGWKFAFFSPENFPPDDFYDDMIHTVTGKTTDRTRPNFSLTEEEYISAMDKIKDNFFFVYPLDGLGNPDFTIEKIESVFEALIWENRVNAVIVDPYIKIRHKMEGGEPEHLYASRFMMDRINFTRKNNVSYHLVMHQTTPRKEKGDNNYPKPSLYKVKGGGTFADSADNVISIWRPNRGSDPLDTTVHFISDKIKKQKLVGIPYEVILDFDRRKNRYISPEGKDFVDGSFPFNPKKPEYSGMMDIQSNNVFKHVENDFDPAPF